MRPPKIWYEAIAGPRLSRLAQRVADAELPRPALRGLITAFCAAFDVNMAEAAVPDGGFRTFNEFFTRALKHGARPVDASPDVLVSPADARLAAAGSISEDLVLEAIKGRDFNLADLLGDDSLAGRLRGGSYATLYLSPRDYHRVHSPCDGVVTDVRGIPGRRYPVMPAAIGRIDGLLARNARTVIRIDSDDFGWVAVVMVGATNVSRITVTPSAGARVCKGDELGAFNLGSTVVIMAQRHALELSSASPIEHMTQVGRPLFERRARPR